MCIKWACVDMLTGHQNAWLQLSLDINECLSALGGSSTGGSISGYAASSVEVAKLAMQRLLFLYFTQVGNPAVVPQSISSSNLVMLLCFFFLSLLLNFCTHLGKFHWNWYCWNKLFHRNRSTKIIFKKS